MSREVFSGKGEGVKVECYAGYKAGERPVRFSIGEKTFEVQLILDRWYSPEKSYFKVKASDGNVYILGCEPGEGWSLESFRREDCS